MEQGPRRFPEDPGTQWNPRIQHLLRTDSRSVCCAEIPPAEPNAFRLSYKQASREGDAAFNEASAAPAAGSGPAPVSAAGSQPPTLGLGQTQQQVIGLVGQPQRQANLGAKVIFFYKDMKITFENGVVTDIQ